MVNNVVLVSALQQSESVIFSIPLFAIYLRYNNAGEYVPRRVQGVSYNTDLRGGKESCSLWSV